MSKEIRYSKELHALAEAEGNALFSVEVNGKPAKKTSITYQGMMDPELAKKLVCFCMIAAEKSPTDAWKKIFENQPTRPPRKSKK